MSRIRQQWEERDREGETIVKGEGVEEKGQSWVKMLEKGSWRMGRDEEGAVRNDKNLSQPVFIIFQKQISNVQPAYNSVTKVPFEMPFSE